MSAYARLKRYRQRRSLEREQFYVAKDWEALGTDPRTWNWRQCASRKRWCIYYRRRSQERQLRHPLPPRQPRHWAGPAEHKRKRQRRYRPTCNPVYYGSWVRF